MTLFEFILFWKVNLLPGECKRFPGVGSRFGAGRCCADLATHSLLQLLAPALRGIILSSALTMLKQKCPKLCQISALVSCACNPLSTPHLICVS